jgi:hypothetical protein
LGLLKPAQEMLKASLDEATKSSYPRNSATDRISPLSSNGWWACRGSLDDGNKMPDMSVRSGT